MNNTRLLLIILCVAMHFGCTSIPPNAGGSSQQGNGVVMGKAFNADGSVAKKAVVSLFPVNFNPALSTVLPDSCIAITDSNGVYFVKVPDSTMQYQILASKADKSTRIIVPNIIIHGDTTPVIDAKMLTTGTITVSISDHADRSLGFIFIPGTDIFAPLTSIDSNGCITLKNVPPGTISAIYYGKSTTSTIENLRSDVVVASSQNVQVYNSDWKNYKRLHLNTTDSGASVKDGVFNFPVLIRLTKTNFNFGEAAVDGSDIRFTRGDNIPLAIQIERWDATLAVAEVWVKVDTILGNNSSQFLTMYWGNSAAKNDSLKNTVFSVKNGFCGVWHLGETDNRTAKDATENRYDGLQDSTASFDGIIGNAMKFTDKLSSITMPNTAKSSLNFGAHGSYSISAWVKVDSLNSKYRIIASKGNKQYNLQMKNTNYWEFAEFQDTMFAGNTVVGWDEAIDTIKNIGEWVYLTGVRDNDKQYLYVNGVCVDSTIEMYPLTDGTSPLRDQSYDFMIGRLPDSKSYYFKGCIDEVRVLGVKSNADWIKLCYMNQKPTDNLVVFK